MPRKQAGDGNKRNSTGNSEVVEEGNVSYLDNFLASTFSAHRLSPPHSRRTVRKIFSLGYVR